MMEKKGVLQIVALLAVHTISVCFAFKLNSDVHNHYLYSHCWVKLQVAFKVF